MSWDQQDHFKNYYYYICTNRTYKISYQALFRWEYAELFEKNQYLVGKQYYQKSLNNTFKPIAAIEAIGLIMCLTSIMTMIIYLMKKRQVQQTWKQPSQPSPPSFLITKIVSSVSLLSIIFSIIYFSITIANNLSKDDYWCKNNNESDSLNINNYNLDDYCFKHFSGKSKDGTLTWGPDTGWYLLFPLAVFQLIGLFFSIKIGNHFKNSGSKGGGGDYELVQFKPLK
ncbi:hypothetical protein DFA_02298 [Cavenderia fasciculata]|uniref:Transmembrane protein n=1 Tax=Cavenderia fasciculata TaxID=261658 RepID=F4PZ25_CACFS|nr:uncharacterized protein DFA_02298 [Cavenderia fasciculata]EGG19054.1 hypothetical protein DFA_02298 [Cavenderia fasciculata]|eukprot:XP_004366687.1 hypothetical protein DFA_02298 [Cavenderia fasciculata]